MRKKALKDWRGRNNGDKQQEWSKGWLEQDRKQRKEIQETDGRLLEKRNENRGRLKDGRESEG